MNDDKKFLQEKITGSHSAILATLEGVDLEQRIHTGSDWRIRDILGHIATWDREVTKSLVAYLNGSEYSIPNLDEDETDFNGLAVAEQRKLSTQDIVAEWQGAREDLKSVVGDIPAERFPGDLLYPWGDERGSIAGLVDFTFEHDEEHREEIIKAVQAPQTG